MTEPPVRYELAHRIARVTLNRPQRRNALSAEVVEGLLAALRRAGSDDAVQVVVLTGAGEKSFCAGGDLGDLARMGEAARTGEAAGGPWVAAVGGPGAVGVAAGASGAGRVAPGAGRVAPGAGRVAPGVGRVAAGGTAEGNGPVQLFAAFRELGKPIIARVAGHALGGGLGLAVSCDIAIAADDVKLGTPEINVGLWPMMIMAVLHRNVGPKQAFKLYYTGQLVGAPEAVRLGLLTEALPRAALDPRVDELAGQIAAKSPAALRLGRTAFFESESLPLHEQLSYLRDQLAVLAATDDAREGIAAFLDRRAARFNAT